MHEGKSALWHLSAVLKWFEQGQRKPVDTALVAVANATMQLNIARQTLNLEPAFHAEVMALIR